MSSLVVRLILYVLLAVAVVAGLTYLWSRFVIAPAEARGYAKAVADYSPQLATLQRDLVEARRINADVATQLTTLKAHYDDYQREADAAKARYQDALAAEMARTIREADAVKRLQATLARAPSTEPLEVLCSRVNAMIDGIIARETVP